MPIREFPERPPIETDRLTSRLADEWRKETDDGPIIFQREVKPYKYVHLYVVWDDWERLNLEERSRIIMDAHESVFGREEVLNVTLAWGLTTAEGRARGLLGNE